MARIFCWINESDMDCQDLGDKFYEEKPSQKNNQQNESSQQAIVADANGIEELVQQFVVHDMDIDANK